MKTSTITKDEILVESMKIAMSEGLESVNIRQVAKQANISIGSVYNYFASKEDLVISTIERIWSEILGSSTLELEGHSFVENIEVLFEKMSQGSKEYPAFIEIHSASIARMNKQKGKSEMDKFFGQIGSMLIQCLDEDEQVNKEFIKTHEDQREFVMFVVDNMIQLLTKRKEDCKYLLHVITRLIY